MKTLILAGGLGTRLKKLTENTPKPMLKVERSPFLEYQLQFLKSQGMKEIILCTGYLSEQIRDFFGSGEKWGLRLEYSKEDTPLGTGGAIKKAEDLIELDYFLVLNGDSLFDFNLKEMVEFHRSQKSLATIALRKSDNTERFGRVKINDQFRITGFVEKGENKGPGLINSGIYIFGKEILNLIPKGREVSLEKDVFPKLVERNLIGFVSQGYFIDIGIPEDYERAQQEIPKHFEKLEKNL